MKNNNNPMSKTQLAQAYKVSIRSFNKWIQPIEKDLGEYIGKIYTPKQIQMIYNFLGRPF